MSNVDTSLVDNRQLAYGAFTGPSLHVDSVNTLKEKLPAFSAQQALCVSAIDELTASIAHEVNQPLAAIVTNAEACLRWLNRDEPHLDKARANLIAIIRNSLRSSAIIREIRTLTLSRRPNKSRVSLNEVIEEAIYFVNAELIQSNVKLRLDLASDLPQVQGDYVQLQQVIVNLLTNAIQALSSVSEPSREIVVQTTLDNDNIKIAVSDNGPGLGNDLVERVFEPYFTTKETGVGLGLAICRSIATVHSGRLWAMRNADHGVTFYLSLPVRGDDARRGQAGKSGEDSVTVMSDKRIATAR